MHWREGRRQGFKLFRCYNGNIEMEYWYRFLQNFIIKPGTWILIHLFYRVEISGRENFRNLRRPLIIVSNHIAFYDSFLLGLALPLFSPLVPLRYMGEYQKFYHPFLDFLRKIGLIPLLFFIMGVFPSRRGEGIDVAIQTPLRILSDGGTVVMFPEGRVSKTRELREFRHGASALALKSGAPVLPVAMKREGDKIFVNIGSAFKLANPHPASIEEGTQKLREKIQELLKP